MKEIVLFSKTKTVTQIDNERIEKNSVSLSVILYIVLILFFVVIAFIMVYNCISMHIQLKSEAVREEVIGNNAIIAVSSWIIGGIALVITILTVIKEMHSANVCALKEKIRKKQKTIVKLGQSWKVIYSTGIECAQDKQEFYKYRRDFREKNGIQETYTPSEVESIINENIL